MNVAAYNFSTGPAPLPDIGELSYNGATFSSLFYSRVQGNQIQDNASRTIRYVEWTISATGHVTLPAGATDIDDEVDALRNLLETDAGVLNYQGRGLGDITVNGPGGIKDVAWGPKPKLLDFQPLGAGNGALVTWTVTTCLPARPQYPPFGSGGQTSVSTFGNFKPGVMTSPVLQFNEEVGVAYDEEGYSSLSLRGTLEVPITRNSVNDRTVPLTADAWRDRFMNRVAAGIDLTRFRITKRHFQFSRDRRTMEWEFSCEEIPAMGLPAFTTGTTGTFSVRKTGSQFGFVQWSCSLRCTYVVPKGQPRRVAAAAFLSLLCWRMLRSVFSEGIPADRNDPNAQNGGLNPPLQDLPRLNVPAITAQTVGLQWWYKVLNALGQVEKQVSMQSPTHKAWLYHYGVDEGLYQDSRRTSFEASWRLVCSFSRILRACGLWQTPKDQNGKSIYGGRYWALSVQDIMGSTSWLSNRLEPNQDVIVDLGWNG